ncbi:acetyl-CoA carboxylase biotin carboxyl carrier protein [Pseudomonas aeruginosa]|nr:biotin/lipoyl-binding protein [Pseudomonas aeruginosa]
MNINSIEQLTVLAQRKDVVTLEYVEGGCHLKLRMLTSHSPAPTATPAAPEKFAAKANVIRSPAMGILRLTHPQREGTEVAPGDSVSAGQKVAFIEFCNLLDPVEAKTNGVVASVLVKDGDVVGYGDALFEIA